MYGISTLLQNKVITDDITFLIPNLMNFYYKLICKMKNSEIIKNQRKLNLDIYSDIIYESQIDALDDEDEDDEDLDDKHIEDNSKNNKNYNKITIKKKKEFLFTSEERKLSNNTKGRTFKNICYDECKNSINKYAVNQNDVI